MVTQTWKQKKPFSVQVLIGYLLCKEWEGQEQEGEEEDNEEDKGEFRDVDYFHVLKLIS